MNNFNKYTTVEYILNSVDKNLTIKKDVGVGIAPANIALVKYWGKSDTDLNIPYTDSLSISLGDLGATTKISIIDRPSDLVILNGENLDDKYFDFYYRIKQYLDLFRNYSRDSQDRFKPYNYYYKVETNVNIPIAAGLASSACGFAALALALNDLFGWDLSRQKLSILARLGSGSAARSLWHGFVYWQRGDDPRGLDSHGYCFETQWPELCVGLLILSDQKKVMSSRQAMLHTVETSILYKQAWQTQVERDLLLIHDSLKNLDFTLLGSTAENNALAMHATMLSAKPAICYSNEDSLVAMNEVWALRKQGVAVYFTQDAGPNLKLLFLKKDIAIIQRHFSGLKIVLPFK